MKIFKFAILLYCFYSCKPISNINFQTTRKVKIVLDTEEPLSTADLIYLTGNLPILGSWNPKGLAMTRRAETRWEKSFNVDDSSTVEFKFTLGSFDREAISNRGVIPGNSHLEVVRDTEVYFVIEDFKSPYTPLQLSSGTTDFKVFHPSNGLASRRITVWLPDGYASQPATKYPVLYVHDGQNQFDSTKTFNRQEWKLDETITGLSRGGKITPPIVVAIDNTSDRNSEYGSVVKESPYADFIIHQLKPWVDSVYRTLPDRKNTATMGSSMGGLIALNLAWYHDDVFSKAACLSPAFKINKFDILKELKKYEDAKKDIMLYVDDGTVGLESELKPGIDETVNYLKTKGYQITYVLAQGAEHNEAAWSKRLDKPLIQFFGK